MVGAELRERLRGLQWERGVRAAIAVGSAMVVCHVLGKPPGSAALGGFDALLADNGGPYRTRLATMATTLVGGAVALVVGSLVPPGLGIAVAATMAVCFVLIFARVLSQPVALSSVLILVLGETLGPSAWVGGGLILAAAVTLTTHSKTRVREPAPI